MPSDDDTCSLGVQSIGSDDDSDVEWGASTGPEDVYDYEPRRFRMPSPHTSFTLGPVSAAPGSFREIKFPVSRHHSAAEAVVFIVFAPLVVARSLCCTVRDPNKPNVSCGFYDGTKVCFLDGEIPPVDSPRVALLYFSTGDSYDPVPEYNQYIRENSQIPCTAITNEYIDPVSMRMAGVHTTDERCLLTVTSATGESSHIPVPVSLIPSIDIFCLVPEAPSSRKNPSQVTPLPPGFLRSLRYADEWVTIALGIITLAFLSFNLYGSYFGSQTDIVPAPSKVEYASPQYETIFLSPIMSQATTYEPSSCDPDAVSSWFDFYNLLNAVADFSHGVVVTSVQSIQAFIANTLLLIETVIQEVNSAIATGTESLRNAALTTKTHRTVKQYSDDVSCRYKNVLGTLQGSTARWLDHARHYYSQISDRKVHFFRKVGSIRSDFEFTRTPVHD